MGYYIFTNNTPKLNVYVLGKLFTRGPPVIVQDVLTRIMAIARGLDYVKVPLQPLPPPNEGFVQLESGAGNILLESGAGYIELEGY